MLQNEALCIEDVTKWSIFSTSLHPREGNIAALFEGHCLADLNSQRSTEFSFSSLSHRGRVGIWLCTEKPYVVKL